MFRSVRIEIYKGRVCCHDVQRQKYLDTTRLTICAPACCSTKRATLIQSYVRMHQARRKFLHDTEVGRRAAERAAAEAVRIAAAVTIQKYVRCRIAVKKVSMRAFLVCHIQMVPILKSSLIF